MPCIHPLLSVNQQGKLITSSIFLQKGKTLYSLVGTKASFLCSDSLLHICQCMLYSKLYCLLCLLFLKRITFYHAFDIMLP